MANIRDTLSHTKWLCKYHIVFTPKYRRKAIYGQYKESIGKILRQLCNYKGVEIIEGHLMPDHIHMLLRFDCNSGTGNPSPTGYRRSGTGDPSPTLGNVIGWYKYQVTKQVNLLSNSKGESVFQRSYYDHVIRNQRDYDEIWQYIENNPRKWLMERQEYKYSSFCRERCPHCSTVQESRFLNAFSDRILSRKYVKKDAFWLVA